MHSYKVVSIDSPAAVTSFLKAICQTINETYNSPEVISDATPIFFFDLEGISLGRKGSISLIQFFDSYANIVYLIDVFVLKSQTFDTAFRGISLRNILQNPAIPKAIWDVRSDSDALYASYGILVDGIIDIQLWELAARHEQHRSHVRGLGKAIELELSCTLGPRVMQEWQRVKKEGKAMFKSAEDFKVFNVRPLSQNLVEYSVGDVTLLPSLLYIYRQALERSGCPWWYGIIEKATTDRVQVALNPKYDSSYYVDKVWSPWTQDMVDKARSCWESWVLYQEQFPMLSSHVCGSVPVY